MYFYSAFCEYFIELVWFKKSVKMYMRNFKISIVQCFYLLILFLFMNSCKESRKERIINLLREWDGKEIFFPPHSIFTIQGNDTVDFEVTGSQYLVVTYLDSVGCSGCQLQWEHWKRFMSEVDSVIGINHVSFLFYLHPKDIEEVLYITRRDKFTYPICLDKKDDFNRYNHLPNEKDFHTFLLNSEKRVVAIGNPVNNPKVKELYFRVLTGDSYTLPTLQVTEIKIDKKNMDWKFFPKNEKQLWNFEIRNIGDIPFVIRDVITSCGCTKVEYSREPVRSGNKSILKISYEAEESGHFRKTIDIYCNVAESPIRLIVSGMAQ